MRIVYAPMFLRMLKALPQELQEEAIESAEAFADKKNHIRLKVHKLKGRLAGRYSFSVNYSTRIVFQYQKPDSAVLLAIGDHDVYRM